MILSICTFSHVIFTATIVQSKGNSALLSSLFELLQCRDGSLSLLRSEFNMADISSMIDCIIDVKYVDPKNKKRKKRVFYEKNKLRKKT